ncbi:histidinol-phosphatase HisJ [Aquibacillus saliphilus]|uniref:histidinol-phosphatase HisJ n=1 Tax=Aquibacillus saliphilus TaxID=1909422 RepID=UPI001CF017E2|nr:histidinol-phosphatase HisJ [Aquibacillus saliphilus]
MKSIGDFHVHTNFCPHGTTDSMESYVLAAIDKGLEYLTFTEHAPLPKNFIDPTPEKDSAMRWEDIDNYLSEANRLKSLYKNKLIINVGFEVDYIEGFEQDTKELLNQYGDQLDDAILSVHMLKDPNGEYVCIDFSVEEFERIINLFGSVDAVYNCYYRTLEKALSSDLGKYKPIRIGHITLIEKFSKEYKPDAVYENEISAILNIIKDNKFELDANTAGLFKEYCGSSYPSQEIMMLANQLSIPLVFGSDSHASNHIARGFNLLLTSSSLPRHLR